MIIKSFFLGFIRIHILFHAGEGPVYGVEMMNELKRHGYSISPGTMYPILHDLEKQKYLKSYKKNVGGKLRRYYTSTKKGEKLLIDARKKIDELVMEVIV